MTEELFHQDSYLQGCDATVTGAVDGAVIVDRTVFYPLGGGQPGDTGTISWRSGRAAIIDTRYGDDGTIRHVLEECEAGPAVGEMVHLALNWDRRYRHMRMHTAMHLLGSVLKYGVTGGNISAEKSRLDFDMEDSVDKEAVTAALAALVAENHAVSCRWISDDELDAQPDLVRTMSVQPPRGKGSIRLLEIEGVDLQPCGGTHLRSTAEVGKIRIGKVEKKGKRNRRVNIHLDD
ncbi:MAG: alanyl-tRNA editing protein [Gammaproteobacteria bacterium]|nr:alanyl-tRNA editing protein [Gammaproteobacteria bacterium]MDH3373993.1 alanyl-tRNA editing protein [Gammaproteobacteria bacterium]MDH3408723.1 alanyl-tRNA editing protein [Gammaproteobacteria bacterium]MDH3553018.1 alanyl-tRNA editing protein [Gammaproteobacteria bacterium]